MRQLEIIKDVVAEKMAVDRLALVAHKRNCKIVEARDITVYLMMQTTDSTYDTAGKALGGRTPATMLHSYRKVAHRVFCDKDQELCQLLMDIQQEVLHRVFYDDAYLFRGAGI